MVPTWVLVSFFHTDRALRRPHLGLLAPAFILFPTQALLALLSILLCVAEGGRCRSVTHLGMIAAMVFILSAASHDRVDRVHEIVETVATFTIFHRERLVPC